MVAMAAVVTIVASIIIAVPAALAVPPAITMVAILHRLYTRGLG
jgi:hypothetical protein